MSSIKPTHLLLSVVITVALAGCGDRNSQAVFNVDSRAHPFDDWVHTHKASAQANITSCAECHGADYSGGISKVSCTSPTAVSGFTCHATSPAVNLTGCVSCHGGPPSGPFGSNDPVSAPNRQFAHTTHTGVLTQIGVTGKAICDTCHLNAGSGTAGHAKADLAGGRSSATVNLSPAFNSNAAVATFDKAVNVCSNVSCHGGQVTPDWTGQPTLAWPTGAIDIVAGVNGDNSVCLGCHAPATTDGIPGLPQFNSFYSGFFPSASPPDLHKFHLAQFGQTVNCTDCHNVNTLNISQQHFSGITTNTFTSPGATIGGIPPTKIGNYDASTKTCSNTVCHIGNHPGSWITAP